MICGICARCKKRKHCKFRQPGTWVVECDQFEDDLQTTTVDTAGEHSGPAQMPSNTQPA